MSTLSRRAFTLLSLCLIAGTLPAHGGQYRGGPALPSPGGRLTPGGGLGGPITPGGRGGPDTTRWQIWWELNKDPYLRRRPSIPMKADGAAAGPAGPAGKPVTLAQKRDLILPALKRALDKTTNRDITSASLIAIGKIGIDHPDFEILPLLRQRLRRGDQEVREAAALALGISERIEAVDDLVALLHDRPPGRRLVDREHVADRTRAFAAYGLGLIAAGHDDVDLKIRVFETLAEVLDSKSEDDRDVLVACLNAIRQIDPKPKVGAKNKRLQWRCLDALDRYRNQTASRSRQLVQAHAAPALARLLGRQSGPDADRFKNRFATTLKGGKRSANTLHQSAALGLGEVAQPAERSPEDASYSELLWKSAAKANDKQVRYFSTIALGQIGGATNMDRLIKLFEAEKGPARAWAALALGLLAHHEPAGTQERAADRLGPILMKGMDSTSNRDVRSAIAVALGLAKYQAAAPELRQLLKKYQKSEFLGGYLCIGLALMDDAPAVPLIEGIIGDAHLRPFLLSQAALALARLQARSAQSTLHGLLRSDKRFTLTWASTAAALGHIGDADSVVPLLEMMQRRSTPKLLQAFAIASLGLIADDKPLPWNAAIAMGINYQALTETMSNGSSGVLDIL